MAAAHRADAAAAQRQRAAAPAEARQRRGLHWGRLLENKNRVKKMGFLAPHYMYIRSASGARRRPPRGGSQVYM
jgi:hypothetical protein